MFTAKMKRYLMLLAALGLVAIAAGGGSGTFASFNAEVANTGNTFQTGTLFLHDTKGSTTCTSEADSQNANTLSTNGCAVLFNVTPSQFTDNNTYTAHLALANAGSLDASDIKFDMNGNGCVDSKPSIGTLSTGLSNGTPPTSLVFATLSEDLLNGTQVELKEGANTHTYTVSGDYTAGSNVTVTLASPDDPGFSYTTAAHVSLAAFGTALCGQLKLNIQEDQSSAYNDPVTGCAFPSSGSACGTTGTLLNDSSFSSLQPLTLDSTGLNGNVSTKLSAKKTRYFTISVIAPNNLGNAIQNDKMVFDLRWHIDQA